MSVEIIPMASFVLLTTFSPGPNNISSASMGVLYGYRQTRPYLLGIATGFFVIMAACALSASFLLTWAPASAEVLKWAGSLYILWLALGMLKAGYGISGGEGEPRAFAKGMLLQLVNPKAMIYGLTLYSTFLAPLAHRPGYLLGLGLVFALTAFTAVSLWALCGAAISARVERPVVRRSVNSLLSLMLVYTAADLAGLV